VRCGRCGNENSESNRFCGMCGASLLAKAQAPGPAAVTVPVTSAPVVTVPIVTAPPLAVPSTTPPSAIPQSVAPSSGTSPSINGPIITGPSFLGLNKPAEGRGAASFGLHSDAGGGHDPLKHTSGNLDYLLEDEDEPKRGWGKMALVVIALALIGGFGYLRWKQGGFNFLKPATTAQGPQSAVESSGTPGTTAPPDAAASDANPNPANPSPATSGAPSQNPAAPDAAASGAGPGTGGAAPSGTETGSQQATPAATAPAQDAPAANTSPAKTQDHAPVEKADSVSTENSEAVAKSESDAQAAKAKPSATRTRERKLTPVTPVDPTAEAERYIYGRGVGQDCDRGLRLLKPAAEKNNPKAMILLGALYSSGTCTPRDLPTAYRWFALALHKDPDNLPLQDDLQKLWSQMTQPERLLAIKLSQ
jgi:hypothetical protein